MNIVSINTLDTRGGGSRLAYDLQNRLISREHSASLFVGKKYSKDPNVHFVQRYGALWRSIKEKTGKDIPRRMRKIINSVFPSGIDFFNMKGLLKSPEYAQADIIHCHNLHGNYFNLSSLVGMAREKPIVWTLHDMWAITQGCPHAFDGKLSDGFYECPRSTMTPNYSWRNGRYLMNKKRRVYAKTPMHIVTPARWLKEKIEYSVLGDHPVHLIHNGVDADIYGPQPRDEARKKLELPLSAKIILFAAYKGRTNPWKGWEHVLKIMEHFKNDPDVILLCVGEEASDRGVDTKQVRYIPYADDKKTMVAYYNAADLLIFTSIAETFPLVILEAMACGLPIVSFNVGGVTDALIHKGNGYIAKYGDTEDIIRGVDWIFSLDRTAIKAMGERSVARIREHFTLDIMTDAYIKLYAQAIEEYRERA